MAGIANSLKKNANLLAFSFGGDQYHRGFDPQGRSPKLNEIIS
jgi:hypothetical protein